jgi:hypothetical protein
MQSSVPSIRPIMQEWVTDIRDQCLRAKVPFFIKQWGGVQKTRSGQVDTYLQTNPIPYPFPYIPLRMSETLAFRVFGNR